MLLQRLARCTVSGDGRFITYSMLLPDQFLGVFGRICDNGCVYSLACVYPRLLDVFKASRERHISIASSLERESAACEKQGN